MQDTTPTPTIHTPVLLHEVVSLLQVQPRDTVVDCTAGGAGHARALLDHLGPQGRYIGIDADSDALERVKSTLHDPRVTLVLGNFRDITRHLDTLGIAHVDRVLADLGFSSDQLGLSGRGFSIDKDEPLLMTYGTEIAEDTVTAWHVVNEWSETSLADVLYGFGGETRARKVAAAIVRARDERPITTSRELAEVVTSAYPRHHYRIHPATKTFQAIRIAVNDELGALESLLHNAIPRLTDHGRIGIISFHSLEDRIVKQRFRLAEQTHQGSIVTKRPVTASPSEQKENPRARSAKLRVFERVYDLAA